MSFGQGSITFSNPPGAGGISVAGARNGLTVDSGGYIVLGQDISAAGNPGELISNREIPQQGFYLNIWGDTTVISSMQHAPSGLGTPLELYDAITGSATRPMALFQQANGTSSATNVLGFTINMTDTFGAFVGGAQIFQVQRNGHAMISVLEDGIFQYLDTRDGTGSVGIMSFAPTAYLPSRVIQSGKQQTISINSIWEPAVSGVGYVIGDIQIAPTINFNTTDDLAYASFRIAGTIRQGAGNGTEISLISITPQIPAALAAPMAAFENYWGNVYLCSQTTGSTNAVGKVSIRLGTAFSGNDPAAYLHIGASDGAAGDTPLKLTAGTSVTVPENGAFEFDGTHLYFTIGVIRHTLI
jgi:hypothetical protein